MWNEKYRMLEEGEIIQEDDEVEVSSGWNADVDWRPALHCIGEPAPNPNYPAHRMYRRLIKND